jgi:hypothetical protein
MRRFSDLHDNGTLRRPPPLIPGAVWAALTETVLRRLCCCAFALVMSVAPNGQARAVEPYEPGAAGSTGRPVLDQDQPKAPIATNHSTTGQVSSLKIQSLHNPILYFTLDDPSGCASRPETYFLAADDPDYHPAFKALLAARLSGREIKLQDVRGCPNSVVKVDASAVRIINSSPDSGPPSSAPLGLAGPISNLKVQEGVVYFRIGTCDGAAPYFKFATTRLPGALALLLAAQSSKRRVEVFTQPSGTGGECPKAGAGDSDIGSNGGGIWLL